MNFFTKNKNEVAYNGGSKNWADVIKNTSPMNFLIWRQPEEDFNTNSTLVVMPGEKAIFVKGGEIEQVFDSGTYILSTENYPVISRLRNVFTGGVSIFNCVVYFVRETDSTEIRWGTDTPVQVRDKVWGIRTEVKARGSYKVRVDDPEKLLKKLIGNNVMYHDWSDMEAYFHNEFQGQIKTLISKVLNSFEQELIGIDAHIDDIGKMVTPKIDLALAEYGLKCVKFSIAALDVTHDKYDEIDKSQIDSIGKIKVAQGDKKVMDILGDNWTKQQMVNVFSDIANNQGMGTIGTELGLGIAAGNMLSSVANNTFLRGNDIGNSQQELSKIDKDDVINVFQTLKNMFDAGLIDQVEYDAKKRELLSRM
ncbi:SPFH domain-containing protein [Anaerovibrio lipolyticus]|uniref:SPFH domain-containing protein n=1 Tax=Anaerovibrio lipolyticus TaxID=82374 RepID=UPI0006843630|nr:SPFH domain-containing protein [Anaerovibrio lipolyticus]